jgi:predicted TIM-barrel fold metal-dependent hydrolase
MIVDTHTHVSGLPLNSDTIYTTYPEGGIFDIGVERQACNIKYLIEDMDRRNIDSALVHGFPEMITNKELSNYMKKHKNRIIGFAGVFDPKSQESVHDLEYAVKELGLKGLKLHPDQHSFSPADQEIVPLIQTAADLDVPVYIHSTPGWMRRGYMAKTGPETFDTLKMRVPDAKLIVGHMGWPRYFDLLTVVGMVPDVYVETSWGLTFIAELHGLEFTSKFLRMLGVDKVLFGSDWVGKQVGMEQQKQLDLINKLDLTREEKDKILGENISKLLNL